MPGQIGTSIRANTRKIHSGYRESDAIDAAGLAQARERLALLGRDVSQLSDDQLGDLVVDLVSIRPAASGRLKAREEHPLLPARCSRWLFGGLPVHPAARANSSKNAMS
jgi:hypothetical protein